AAASSTEMRYLPMLDASTDPYPYGRETRHDRGYADFVKAAAVANAQGFAGNFTGRGGAKATVFYLRMSRFFTWSDSGNPQLNADGETLVRALGKFNVYSVSSCNSDARQSVALEVVRGWVRQHRQDQDFGFAGADYAATVTARDPQGRSARRSIPLSQLTETQVDGLDERILQKVLWHLDEAARASDRELLDYLYERSGYPAALVAAVTAHLDRKIQQAKDPA